MNENENEETIGECKSMQDAILQASDAFEILKISAKTLSENVKLNLIGQSGVNMFSDATEKLKIKVSDCSEENKKKYLAPLHNKEQWFIDKAHRHFREIFEKAFLILPYSVAETMINFGKKNKDLGEEFWKAYCDQSK